MTIAKFKRLARAEIELGSRVVFIGPNNSGKTSALQALSLWNLGVKRWDEKRGGKTAPEKRPGVLISRRDISAIPIPSLDQLWSDRHLRDVIKIERTPHTKNVALEITVEGIRDGVSWSCGLEFDYRDEESIYVRPLRTEAGRMPVPAQALTYSVDLLPPMSGLSSNELRLDMGAIDTRIGEGRTAEVLRNLCYVVSEQSRDNPEKWDRLIRRVHDLFRVTLDRPLYIQQRGEIEMSYQDDRGTRLDISAAGRGLQQTLMLLTYMEAHPKSVLLLDEPDAHLEIVRQREIYSLLSEYAAGQDSQLIAASHSEVVLEEAAQKDVVIAFVGPPHRMNDRGSQLRKALSDIAFVDYYQAEEKKFVLYLEGATDLSILQSFARRLKHDSLRVLEQPFVKYVANHPNDASKHFHGLLEASVDLRGFALFDRLDPPLRGEPGPLFRRTLQMREIENYLCSRAALLSWAQAKGIEATGGPLLGNSWRVAMEEAIIEVEGALRILGEDPWGPDIKASDRFLTPLFENLYARLGLPNLMRKSNFHELAPFLELGEIDSEIVSVLDDILSIAPAEALVDESALKAT